MNADITRMVRQLTEAQDTGDLLEKAVERFLHGEDDDSQELALERLETALGAYKRNK
jgi:hypothetical protein